MRYNQQQEYRYNDGKNLEKYKLMILALKKYKHMCTKDKWLARLPGEQAIVALSAELEKNKDTNLKLEKVFKAKWMPKKNSNNQVNQKENKKRSPKQKNDNTYAWKKFPPKQVKKETKIMHNKTYKWCNWHKSWVENDP